MTMARRSSSRLTPGLWRYLWLGLLLLPAISYGAFISDNIEINIYSQPGGRGVVVATIGSGSEVEVLNEDGEYSRILTGFNLTGWVESKYLSEDRPETGDIQSLQQQNQDLRAELQAARAALLEAQDMDLSPTELEELRKRANDVGWMRVELKKARDKVNELEATLKTRSAKASNSNQELDQLRTQNAELAKRLAAALLVNSQQEVSGEPENQPGEESQQSSNAPETESQTTRWRIKLEWFLGSLVVAIIIGLVVGMIWMDKRMRRRHGGFRLY